MNGSTESAEIEITTEEAILTEATTGEFYYLESIFRRDRPVKKGEPGGNLLKALKEGTKINMTFTGETRDEAAVFQIKKCKKSSKRANCLCYCSEDGSYYLAVDTENEGQVKLCQLDSSPTEDKYLFKVKAINQEVNTFHTFLSLIGKNKYLHCEEDGSVSVREATSFQENRTPSNRQTWFRKLKGDVCQCGEENNETCVECEIATISETVEDNEDSGKCISMETSADEVIEDEDASCDPEKRARNEQGKGKYKDLQEVVSADNPMKESSEESGKATSEHPDVGKEKGCCRNPGREKSEEAKEAIPADLKGEIPGNAAKENFEDAAKRKYPHGNPGTSD